jgi:hypothetical protein
LFESVIPYRILEKQKKKEQKKVLSLSFNITGKYFSFYFKVYYFYLQLLLKVIAACYLEEYEKE